MIATGLSVGIFPELAAFKVLNSAAKPLPAASFCRVIAKVLHVPALLPYRIVNGLPPLLAFVAEPDAVPSA